MDKNIFSKLTYGMYIISTKYEDKMAGCVVNTLTQVAEDPDMVAFAVRKASVTGKLIDKSKCFTASILLEKADMDMVGEFGFKNSAEVNKFENVSYKTDKNGTPYITEGVAAWFSCQVTDTVDVGSHYVIIGRVTDGELLSDDKVMTYSGYKDNKNKSTGWRCTVCGYVYEGEVLPEGFICPWCNVGTDLFEKIN